jgi:branched-chain amino acid transport system substrate-binding protein
MNKLVAQGHKFVVGDQISGVTLSVAPIAEENKIIHIAPGSSNPKVTDAGDYTFRTKVSATVESKAVTAYLVDDLKITSAAFLYQNSDYGKGVFNAVKADLDAGEIAITASESFEVGATDLRTQLLKIKATNPDIIVLTGFAKEVGQIMKQAKELGVTAKFIAHSGSIGPDIVKVGGASADGLLALLETSPDMSDPRTKSFYDRYISRYKEEPEVFTLLAYDTLILLGNQVRACDEDVECVKKGLYKLKEEGITGTMSFDKNGDIVRNSFTLFTIKDSKFVSVK